MGSSSIHNHVLMVSLSAQGHLNPMIRLANLLASKGLEITLATNEFARDMLLSSTTTATNTATNTNTIHLDFFSDGLPIDYDRKSNFEEYIKSISTFAPQNLSKLITNSSKKFSCIIINSFVPWVTDVALEHGIPCGLLWIQPCALYAIYYRFFNEINHFPIESHIEIELPGFPILKTQDLPSFILPSNTIESLTKLLCQLFHNINKLKWVFVNSFYELEKEIVESMNELSPLTPIGPLVPATLLGLINKEESNLRSIDMWKPEESCIEWLDKKPTSSVIYVSFGSVSVLSANQMKNLAMGLKKSNHSFLWVVKPSENPGNDGKGELPSGFLEEIGEDRGLVVAWCPQTKVLNHPSIACFITHCGWNSTLEAVCSGVPVIGFPQWTDQPTNAKLITDVFQMGLRMTIDENGDFTEEDVLRCINEVMCGEKKEEFKKKAEGLKEQARNAVGIGGSSDRNIQIFIDEITNTKKMVFGSVNTSRKKQGRLSKFASWITGLVLGCFVPKINED